MRRKNFGMLLMVLVSLIIASFIAINIKNGMSEAQPAGMGEKGNILYVGGSGPNNYTRIQDAIDNASNGDTIFVYSGTYYENIVINKSISLIGENKETTIIDALFSGDVVEITADNVTIQEFTVRNSGGNGRTGIYVYYSSYNEVYNCNISNNWYGICAWYSNENRIYNCNITSNNDYGIRLSYSSNNEIYNCNISNNDYGIRLSYSSNNEIYNCNISNNYGGIGAYSSSNNSIYNCNISNNDPGIWLHPSSNNEVYNCNISNNFDGIRVWYSNENKVYNCNIINNNYHGIWLYYSNENEVYGSVAYTGDV